jgi:glycosyltransferase involved in cell wall biosynthesis
VGPVSVSLESSPPERSVTRPVPLGIVIAVRNEERWLDELFESLVQQADLGSVVCIAVVDGRSEDNSRVIVRNWIARLPMLRLLENAARIAPVAFNIGIRACRDAGADVVLMLSGHGSLHSGFLSGLQEVLASDDAAIVGCVHDFPTPVSSFERASQAFAESRLGRRLRSFSRLKGLTETDLAMCPAIRAEVFDSVGLFDETMVRNQDIDFQVRARAAGFRIVTAPQLKSRYSPPTSLGRLLRQMYGNGLWVGYRVSSHQIRHLVPSAFVGGLVLVAAAAVVEGGIWKWVLAAIGGTYLAALLGATLTWSRKIGRSAVWLPLLFVGSHFLYAAGTFRGVALRGSRRAERRVENV